MLLILALIYGGFVWLAFYKLKIMEFTPRRQIIVAGIGVIAILAIVFTIMRTSPMTSNLRVTSYVIPIGSRSGGRVTRVYVNASQMLKTGDKYLTSYRLGLVILLIKPFKNCCNNSCFSCSGRSLNKSNIWGI